MYSIELEKKIVLFTDDDQKRAQIEERKEKIDGDREGSNEIK